MADPTAPTGRKCHTCKKDETATDRLKHCGRCMSNTILYCSRECQVANYKVHKQTCVSKTQTTVPTDTGKEHTVAVSKEPTVARTSDKALQVDITKPFHQLDAKKWLHGRPAEDVYKFLIDVYRMRIEDEYKHGGTVDNDSIYAGAKNGKMGFTRFLRLVEQKHGLLPDWWSPSKATDCVRYGVSVNPSSEYRSWSDLSYKLEKPHVTEHYRNPFMPMQLRLFAEQVYGSGPGGKPVGNSMVHFQMMVERGTHAPFVRIG
ncbi:hypothetical protein N7475_001008 [Penicillium sp. IBT 31633x]|nr:hypothetical protein N7475_001008 [Penicillium sp. IBT 31633x]